MAFGNGPRLVTTGLDLLVDAADKQSYPGSGTVWTDLRSGITGSLTGSVSYTSEYYGGLTFTDSTSAVIFPGTTANYGTGTFTVEMAFKPDYIEGRHYLMAKNSGSYPNWAVYLSGSGGSGKLWSEFNVSAAISCSVSSSTTFETGSVYQVDVRIAPFYSASSIYIDGNSEVIGLGNNGGSLTTTASLFVGNFSQDNTQNFSGSIYTIKTYLNASIEQPVINFNATSTRFSKPPVPETAKKRYEILVVAGGGGGGNSNGGGGGAGGLQLITTTQFNNINTVVVGDGGIGANDGKNSSFLTYTSIGGGRGGGELGGNLVRQAGDGGSGGGQGYNSSTYGLGTSGQGNNGGSKSGGLGGGGGAGSVGQNGIGIEGGNGGSGSYIPSFAAIGGFPAGWFAGGGAGSPQYNGGSTIQPLGGIGGGGNAGVTSTSTNPTTGSANTGGGGGGGRNSGNGAKGGSGIVAIRYLGGPIALGGEITQSAGYTYHVYRTVGTSSFTIF